MLFLQQSECEKSGCSNTCQWCITRDGNMAELNSDLESELSTHTTYVYKHHTTYVYNQSHHCHFPNNLNSIKSKCSIVVRLLEDDWETHAEIQIPIKLTGFNTWPVTLFSLTY